MERNGISQRNVQSTPSSPQGARPSSFEVIGSAESLVGRVSRRDLNLQNSNFHDFF